MLEAIVDAIELIGERRHLMNSEQFAFAVEFWTSIFARRKATKEVPT